MGVEEGRRLLPQRRGLGPVLAGVLVLEDREVLHRAPTDVARHGACIDGVVQHVPPSELVVRATRGPCREHIHHDELCQPRHRSGRDARRPATKWTPDRAGYSGACSDVSRPFRPAPNSGKPAQRVANVPAAGSTSTSSRCGVARKAMSTAKRPSSSVGRAGGDVAGHRPLLGQRDLGGPDVLVQRHPPAVDVDARQRTLRRGSVGRRGERPCRQHQRVAPLTAARRAQLQAGQPFGETVIGGRRRKGAIGERRQQVLPHQIEHGLHLLGAGEHGDDGVLLRQHDHVLAVGAVAAISVLRHPQLESVALLPVRLLALRVGDLHRRRLGHPTLREQPAHRRTRRRRGTAGRVGRSPSRLVYTPEKPMSQTVRQLRPAQVGDAQRVEHPRSQVVDQPLTGQALEDACERDHRRLVVGEQRSRLARRAGCAESRAPGRPGRAARPRRTSPGRARWTSRRCGGCCIRRVAGSTPSNSSGRWSLTRSSSDRRLSPSASASAVPVNVLLSEYTRRLPVVVCGAHAPSAMRWPWRWTIRPCGSIRGSSSSISISSVMPSALTPWLDGLAVSIRPCWRAFARRVVLCESAPEARMNDDARLPIDPDLAPTDPGEPVVRGGPRSSSTRRSRVEPDVLAVIALGGMVGATARYRTRSGGPELTRALPMGDVLHEPVGQLPARLPARRAPRTVPADRATCARSSPPASSVRTRRCRRTSSRPQC